MADLRNRIHVRFPKISISGIKLLAALLLLIVNANSLLLEKGLLQLDGFSSEELLAAMDASSRFTTLVGVASILRLLSGVAVPLFAFALAEGFVHTSDFKKYFGAVAVTALVSEPIYDYAFYGRLFDFSQQNPVFGVLIGLAMLGLISKLDSFDGVERGIGSILLVLCGAFWVVLLQVEYGIQTVVLAAVFYCFREKLVWKILLGVLCSVFSPLGPMAICLLPYYSGQKKTKLPKYTYYVFYPLHLLVLGLVTRQILL